MSFDFSTSMNKITDLYLDTDSVINSKAKFVQVGEEAKQKFGDAFAEAYDSMQAMRALNDTMRTSYEMNNKDDLQEKSSAMTFSKGSSRILDMLNTQISDDMQEKVNVAMSNALKSL